MASTASASYFRLVVLNPAITEIVFSLGAGGRIVGTTEFSDYPKEAKSIPRVGSYASPSIEKILALKPDLVLLSPEGVDKISESLKQAGLKYQFITLKNLSDYATAVNEVAKTLDIENQAPSVLQDWDLKWQKLSLQKSSYKIIVQVDHEPLIIAGGDTFLSETIEHCGGKNVFASLKGYPKLSLETLAQSSADVVVVTVNNVTEEFRATVWSFWMGRSMKKKPKVVFVNPDDVSRLSRRLPDAAYKLCETLKKL